MSFQLNIIIFTLPSMKAIKSSESYRLLLIVFANSSNSDSDYYKFTWDHMAKYDLPASINHVLKHSNFKKVTYLGYSQGTTQFFAACDVVDGIKDKINAFVGWAPVMFVGNITNPFVRMAVSSPIPTILKSMGMYNIGLFPDHYYPKFKRFASKFRNFFWRIVGLI